MGRRLADYSPTGFAASLLGRSDNKIVTTVAVSLVGSLLSATHLGDAEGIHPGRLTEAGSDDRQPRWICAPLTCGRQAQTAPLFMPAVNIPTCCHLAIRPCGYGSGRVPEASRSRAAAVGADKINYRRAAPTYLPVVVAVERQKRHHLGVRCALARQSECRGDQPGPLGEVRTGPGGTLMLFASVPLGAGLIIQN